MMIPAILKKFARLRRPQADSQPVIQSRWIETADERCPIACTWFTIAESIKDLDDDPGSTWPVFLRVRWKAGFFSQLPPLFSVLNIISGCREA
jgi:hypothetical protein